MTSPNPPFRAINDEVMHCGRCHKVIRLYDATDQADAAAMLDAHLWLTCVESPTAALFAGDQR